jgi:hypothetical protein
MSQQSLEIVGQRGDKLQPIAAAWVIENQFIGVKCLSWKRFHDGVVNGWVRLQFTFVSVDAVADQGMA